MTELMHLENCVALSACFHTHKDYESFYDRFGNTLNGFTGIYDLVIAMAVNLSTFEARLPNGWDSENLPCDWAELTETYAAYMIEKSLALGMVHDVKDALEKSLELFEG